MSHRHVDLTPLFSRCPSNPGCPTTFPQSSKRPSHLKSNAQRNFTSLSQNTPSRATSFLLPTTASDTTTESCAPTSSTQARTWSPLTRSTCSKRPSRGTSRTQSRICMREFYIHICHNDFFFFSCIINQKKFFSSQQQQNFVDSYIHFNLHDTYLGTSGKRRSRRHTTVRLLLYILFSFILPLIVSLVHPAVPDCYAVLRIMNSPPAITPELLMAHSEPWAAIVARCRK